MTKTQSYQHHLRPVGLALLVFALPSASSAVEIVWGNAAAAIPSPDRIFDAAGLSLDSDPGAFTFALGTFGNFVPQESNYTQWWTNWKPLDYATFNPANDYFSSTFELVDNDTFPIGEDLYFFLYKTEMVGITEASLFRSPSWEVPDAQDGRAFPYELQLSEATVLPFGGVGSTQGPGTHTPPPGGFNAQLHALQTPIPEPSVAGLTLLGMLAGLCRRRR
jgi:hypothetical protein